MPYTDRYSAYQESQNEQKASSEIVEKNRDIKMMNEGQDVFFDRYRAMNQRERRAIKARVARRAILSLGVPLTVLIVGFWMDNAFVIVVAVFLTLGMLAFAGYYIDLYIKLHSLDAKISSAGVRRESQISERMEPIDQLKMSFERSEMRDRLATSKERDNGDPFRRK